MGYRHGWRNQYPQRVRLLQNDFPALTLHRSYYLPSSDIVYIAPSGVQKERIKPEHMFVLPYTQPDTDRVFLRAPPAHFGLKESACTPLFWNAFGLRNAGACIHTHSQHAVMATLFWPGKEFKISHQVCVFNSFSGKRRTVTNVDYAHKRV